MVVSTRIASLVVAVVFVALGGCDDKAPATSTAAPSATSASVTSTTAPTSTGWAASSASAAPPASTPTPPATIAAQHVLVAFKGAERAPKGITRTKAQAKERAEEVAAKAKAGADFSALVAEYSDDPAAKERRGSLGKFTRDKMAKAFSDAAFALAVDETSGAVETPFGYHVIKRNQ